MKTEKFVLAKELDYILNRNLSFRSGWGILHGTKEYFGKKQGEWNGRSNVSRLWFSP